MSLEDWRKNGWLKPHKPSPAEIADLLALDDRDLKDCRAKGLSNDDTTNPVRIGTAINPVTFCATKRLTEVIIE